MKSVSSSTGFPFDIVTLADWPLVAPPEETGQTFEENARAKALYYAAATGELTVAEDSGLEIDALDGAPGRRIGALWRRGHAIPGQIRADLRGAPRQGDG